MNVTIIGTGFVGVVSSGVFASFGNIVYGLDVDAKKIGMLQKGEIPFYEPGLQELVKEGQKSGKLMFTTSYEEAINNADVIMIAVGTPSASDGQADLKYVWASTESMAPHLKDGAIIAVKSTVPPGTCYKVAEILEKHGKTKVFVASLPEFLKEGTAVEDTLHPDRVVIGATEPEVIERLKELHAPLKAPFVVMRPESAQMCKYASNAYLATRITYINHIANLCEVNGADIQEVIEGIGYDKRIGKHYWYPGFGYGGSCFPKDVKELAAYAKGIGQQDNLLVTVSNLNEERIPKLMARYEKEVGGWGGKKVAVLGLSFKPNTDDMREAPSTRVIPLLTAAGATVSAYDPMAMEVSSSWFPDWKVSYAKDAYEAVTDADIIFVLVEWPELISLDVKKIAAAAKKGALFIDARNQYAKSRTKIVEAGMKYKGVGTV